MDRYPLFLRSIVIAVLLVQATRPVFAQQLSTPSDPLSSEQWYLGNPLGTESSMKAGLDLPRAWHMIDSLRANRGLNSTGSQSGICTRSATRCGPVVAIIDTGVNWQHPDLAERIFQNSGEDLDGDGRVLEFINGAWEFDPDDINGVDDDGNGYPDDFIGWDFIDNDNDPMDRHGHGTHLAGTIGASRNNQKGIAGVYDRVLIMPLRLAARSWFNTDHLVDEAMGYAAHQGATIANISWQSFNYDRQKESAMYTARVANILVVGTAGSSGTSWSTNIDSRSYLFPSSRRFDNLITVTAHTQERKLRPGSNYGLEKIHVSAPGERILSTVISGYAESSGPSMSTALASGIAALVLDQFPDLSPAGLRDVLVRSSVPSGDLSGKIVSGGRLSASKALQEGLHPVAAEQTHFELHPIIIGESGNEGILLWNRLSQPIEVELLALGRTLRLSTDGFTLGAGDSTSFSASLTADQAARVDGRILIKTPSTAQRPAAGLEITIAADTRRPVLEVSEAPVEISTKKVYAEFLSYTSRRDSFSVHIGNGGSTPLYWQIESLPHWLDTETRAGMLEGGAKKNLYFRSPDGGYPPGRYAGNIIMTSSDVLSDTVRVPVRIDASGKLDASRYDAVSIADINGDGNLDIVGVASTRGNATSETEGKHLELAINRGENSFTSVALGERLDDNRIAVTDLDQDGLINVLFCRDHTLYDLEYGDSAAQAHSLEVECPRGRSLAAGDVDGDADVDILGTSRWYEKTEAGYKPRDLPIEIKRASSTSWSDIDHDGDLDAFVVDALNAPYFLLINESSSFFDAGFKTQNLKATTAAFVHLDGDSYPDLVVSGRTCSAGLCDGPVETRLYRNRAGTWIHKSSIQGGRAAGRVQAGDLTGDGVDDIVLSGPTGTSLLMSGSLQSDFSHSVTKSFGLRNASSALGDLNNDGRLDLLLTGEPGGGVSAEPEPGLSLIHINSGSFRPEAAEPPDSLEVNARGRSVTLSWTPPDDFDAGMTFDVELVNRESGSFIRKIPMGAGQAGQLPSRAVAQPGYAGRRSSMSFKDLPEGHYDWRLQTVDAAFRGSPVVAGPSFRVSSNGWIAVYRGEQPGQPDELTISDPYPNPTADAVNFRIRAPGTRNVEVRWYDLLGRRVGMRTSMILPPGESRIRLDIPDKTAAGTYHFVVQTESGWQRSGTVVVL